MEHCIEIILTDEEGYIKASLEEYVQKIKTGSWPAELPDPEYAGYRWHTGEKNEMTGTIYPGQLNMLILQFEEAGQRLDNNEPAVIHFGEYGGEGGSYTLLLPEAGQVKASVFFVQDSRIDGTLPIKDAIGDPDKLYKYVAENTGAILEAGEDDGMYFKHIGFPAEDMKTALKKGAEAGHELYRLCNEALTSRFVT